MLSNIYATVLTPKKYVKFTISSTTVKLVFSEISNNAVFIENTISFAILCVKSYFCFLDII